jgi:REP element-mobilizing transposase RayT
LKDSLPRPVLQELTEESERNKQLPLDIIDLAQRRWFGKFDEYLGRGLCGEMFLRNELVANIVAEAIRYRDGKVYTLDAFTIMPNHGHLVFTPLEKDKGVYYSLTEILQSLKRHTARKANEVLGRSGAFWQDESYDHIVRNQAELERIIQYVINNPVKAGLVEDWKKWKWTYCKYDL